MSFDTRNRFPFKQEDPVPNIGEKSPKQPLLCHQIRTQGSVYKLTNTVKTGSEILVSSSTGLPKHRTRRGQITRVLELTEFCHYIFGIRLCTVYREQLLRVTTCG